MPKKKKEETQEQSLAESLDLQDSVVEDEYTEEAEEKKSPVSQELLDKLVQMGKARNNTLEIKDISTVFQNVTLSAENIDDVIAYLESQKIDVLRMLPDDSILDDDFLDGDLDLMDDVEDDLDLDIDNIDLLEGVSTGDPVRMYLKEIGTVQLLTA
ncbi:MAG: hypothetical protein IIY77_00765, partial [Lachnospiraceae bacterium]|nr:hypothetical protein [Lachnospiraceae bacterium]